MSYVMHVRNRTCDIRHRVAHRAMSYVRYDIRHRHGRYDEVCMYDAVPQHATSCHVLTTSYVFISTYRIRCRMSKMDTRCRMYMTYDIVGSYRIRHSMYVRCRMSTYDIVYQTYDIVRLIEGAVSAGLKEPDALPTAQANDCCLFYRKSFIFSIETSKTV